MQKFKWMYIAVSAIFLAACGDYLVEEVFAELSVYQTLPIFTTVENYVLAPLEIDGRVHLGINFHVDTSPTSNQMEEFEALAGQHSIFTNTIYLGEDLPEMWFWEMIARGRIPNVILQPTNALSPFERMPLRELAQALGRFHTPMFLQIFPEARSHGYHPEYYTEFWRYAREVFRVYAPQVALVFSIYEGDVLDFLDFFPGNNYVDWVAINHYVILENGTSFSEGAIGRLEAFYQIFNRYKPMMINFGISHFSTVNHMYHSLSTGSFLEEFYKEILERFPRVRAMIYMDINFVEHPTNRNRTDNFSITDNQIVLNYYLLATQNPYFSRQASASTDLNETTQLIRSTFQGIRWGNEIFLPHHFLLYDVKVADRYLNQYLLPHRQEFMGQVFYHVDILESIGLQLEIYQNNVIILSS